MTAISNLFKTSKFKDALAENQDLIANHNGRAKYHLEAALSNNEVRNIQEEEYYNKASGCSVRAQKDNLFDYKSWIKI
jgi:hypothetical protein